MNISPHEKLFYTFIVLHSYRSQEWSLISPEEKETMGLRFDADGEFW